MIVDKEKAKTRERAANIWKPAFRLLINVAFVFCFSVPQCARRSFLEPCLASTPTWINTTSAWVNTTPAWINTTPAWIYTTSVS